MFRALFDRIGNRPSHSQQFIALEAEQLLSHSTETVLRYARALVEPSACPRQRTARVKAAGELWVKRHIAEASDDDLDRLVDDRLFMFDQTVRAGGIPDLREFADLFLMPRTTTRVTTASV